MEPERISNVKETKREAENYNGQCINECFVKKYGMYFKTGDEYSWHRFRENTCSTDRLHEQALCSLELQSNHADLTLSCPVFSARISLKCQNPFQLPVKQTTEIYAEWSIDIFDFSKPSERTRLSVSPIARTCEICAFSLCFCFTYLKQYHFLSDITV